MTTLDHDLENIKARIQNTIRTYENDIDEIRDEIAQLDNEVEDEEWELSRVNKDLKPLEKAVNKWGLSKLPLKGKFLEKAVAKFEAKKEEIADIGRERAKILNKKSDKQREIERLQGYINDEKKKLGELDLKEIEMAKALKQQMIEAESTHAAQGQQNQKEIEIERLKIQHEKEMREHERAMMEMRNKQLEHEKEIEALRLEGAAKGDEQLVGMLNAIKELD